ncbi:MAG: CBS domain-containing protein [Nitrosarchaeum sp.]|nr:CBS domain-containing protein [Nitrosarchaeum sp.]
MSRGNYAVPVKDIMSKAIVSVNPETTSFQISKMMEQGGIGAVIVQEENMPVGIITDRDFAIKIAANNMPHDTPARKIMSSPLVTISHDKSLVEAAKTMSIMKIRKLAVSDRDAIVGIITSTDLVDHLT